MIFNGGSTRLKAGWNTKYKVRLFPSKSKKDADNSPFSKCLERQVACQIDD